jgi:hypothetical protein
MPKGGARKGAGRPRGSANRMSRELADKINSGSVLSPLEVMLKCMEQAFHAVDDNGNPDPQYDEAARYANMAAPYCHPRLQSIDQTSDIVTEVRVIDEFGYSRDREAE